MKDVQCYELFGGIALKNHAFSFFFIFNVDRDDVTVTSVESAPSRNLIGLLTVLLLRCPERLD